MKTAIRTMVSDLRRVDDAAHLDALCDSMEIAAVQDQLNRAVSMVSVRDVCMELTDEDITAVVAYCAASGVEFTAADLAWFRRPVRS